MNANAIQLDTLTDSAGNLRIEKEALFDDYQAIKSEVNTVRESSNQQLERVFPTEEGLTNLNRLFDDFAVKNNFSSNPLFISNIVYQQARKVEDSNYSVVPMVVSVTSSRKNLDKFLEFVEMSGSLESEIRLMSIEEMTLNYPAVYGDSYTARFLIYAYYSNVTQSGETESES